MTTLECIEVTYRTELVRKAIHLCSLIIPVIYFFIPRTFALATIIPATFIFIIIDIGRYYNPLLQEWFYSIFGSLLRRHESDAARKRLNGASYVLISATLCILLFSKPIMLAAFCVMIIGDTMAALIGIRFGRHKFFNKSIEGSLAFFVSGLVIICIIPNLANGLSGYILAAFSVAVGAIVEALPWEIDDNLTIPLAVGLVLWSGQHFLLAGH